MGVALGFFARVNPFATLTLPPPEQYQVRKEKKNMAFSKGLHREAMQTGLDDANSITPSVIASARLSGIKANVFAKALIDDEANSNFRNDVAQALQKIYVAKAVAEAAADAVTSLKEILGLKKKKA